MPKRKRWEPNPNTILEDLIKVAAKTRRNTDPMPPYVQAALAKAHERKRRARNKRCRDNPVPSFSRRHREIGYRLVDRVLRRMEPDHWYGLKAVARAAGLLFDEVGRVKTDLLEHAWASRVANPRWDVRAAQTRWCPNAPEVCEPKYLYRLTDAGVAERTRQMALRLAQ